MFKLKIATDNAAFDGLDKFNEIARILRGVENRIEDHHATTGVVHDSNGNSIGSWCIEDGGDKMAANARLIAAAPDLLTALDRLARAAACRENTMGDPIRLLDAQAELRAATAHARAAIAKAEGEDPE